MGRVLDGIRLSGMLRSEIALVLRKKQLHIFLCFHQLLHLIPLLCGRHHIDAVWFLRLFV